MLYVDNARIPKGRRLWCHLYRSSDDNEIHEFAHRLGLKRHWFHVDHYDVTPTQRQKAIELGATPCDVVKLVEIRQGKRKAKEALEA